MLLQVMNFRLWMKEKLGQRGAALVEYAILLAFVAVIGATFLAGDGLTDKIKSIIGTVKSLLGTAASNAGNAVNPS